MNNGYSNKEVNDLIVKQAGEKDESARGDILKQIQKLETEDLSTIPLLQGAQVAVTGTSVKGVTLSLPPLPLCLRHQGLIQHELGGF